MRFFGHKSCFTSRQAVRVSVGASLVLLIAAASSPVFGQTAPYVLPYTMSTFAGPNPAYTPGAACTNSSTGVASPNLVALNGEGDGCPAPDVEVGADPHDIRVDARGNVYWIDDGSEALIQKIDAHTLQQTVFVGSTVNSHACSAAQDTAGDGCTSTDGAANNNPAVLTTSSKFKAQRGLAVAANGDLYSAGYNDYNIHKVSASTGIFSLVAGTSASATASSAVSGPLATTPLFSPRGVGIDAAGNVYIADTSLNVVQEVIGSNIIALTAANSAGTKAVVSGVLATTAQVDAPEDVKIDSFGNVYIADAGNNVIRAIYEGSGTLPGISNPIAGYIYTIAGGVVLATGAANTTYPSDGTTPTVPATSVAFTSSRKIALDSLNNLYIADSSNTSNLGGNVVWFVDHATGDIRVIAGRFGQTASLTPSFICATSTDAVGDGCPGPSASLYSASDMGADPDNQGNLYITDAEGGGGSVSRLRKLLSGLNFPSVAMGASLTQTVQIHFAPGDTLSSGVIPASDFTVGSGNCTVEADTTTDCLFQVTFKPTVPGDDTATFTIKSTLGGVNTYLLTGTGSQPELAIDPGLLSAFNTTVKNAQGVATDEAGNIYIADTANNRVLKYTASTGVTSTLAGTGAASHTGDGGLATVATLSAPKAVTVDTSGSVYIADTGNNVVRRVDASTGIITTYAGGATTVCAAASDARGDNCPATQATFSAPSGLAMDNLGQLYVSDTGNNVIRQISVSDYISTFAGGATQACGTGTDTLGDGCGALQADFSAPAGLAYDEAGNYLFLADSGNSIIRKIYIANAIATAAGSATATAIINPVTLVAGNGQAGSSVDSGSSAILSQLNKPLGVAVDSAENIYIADTGNSAIRLVSGSTGLISTIVGINAASGDTAVPGSAASVELNAPAAVAVTQSGTLYLADSANNRVLSDNRGQIAYDFGRTNIGEMSPVESFDELSIGNLPASIAAAAPLFTASGDTTQFTLTAPTGSNACTAGASLAGGTGCALNGQFVPTAMGNFSATYAETSASPTAGGEPSITLTGVGAVLTPTASSVAQTSPATGNAQFGAALTLTATVVPSTCNTAAPSCNPTGTVRIGVDGTFGSPVSLNTSTPPTASQSFSGLSVGSHTVTCSYSGDDFYAASSCGSVSITVAAASTTSVLTATNNNQTQYPTNACVVLQSPAAVKGDIQCTATTLNATVTSNTTGSPTGTVTFYASGGSLGSTPVALGSSPLSATTGIASLPLTYVTTPNGFLVSDSTLPAGSYSLTCTYGGATNYATSNCTAVPYIVAAQSATVSLTAYGCSTASLSTIGSSTLAAVCPNATSVPTIPTVATAEGATTDATILIIPTNTASGTLTFACSGLPANSDCTFSPTSMTLTPGKTYASPIGVDVTFFNDLQPGAAASLSRPAGKSGIAYASILGWPLALFGLSGLLGLGRSKRARHLALLATLLLVAGTSLVLTGCNGPGAYQPVLTPAGTYPVIVTVSGAGITKSIQINYTVTAPGIPGQE